MTIREHFESAADEASAGKDTFRPYNTPFVEGILVEALGSISTAILKALPKALNTVSI